MQKRVKIACFFLISGFILALIPLLYIVSPVSAASSSIDSEIKKLTHYAEEYETGNIDYVRLLTYMSAIRESMNEILGASHKEMGGIVKQEKLQGVLGNPIEQTKWVWIENEQHEMRLDEAVPRWEKIVFDGKKIQIRLNAHPSIFKKNQEIILFYRIHPEIMFKKPEEDISIENKFSEIKELAEIFNADPTRKNAEILAEESVNAEKAFESYFRQNPEDCESVMKSIFGSENQVGSQEMIVQEITFYEGDNFEAIARLEFCDECEWNWINLDLWVHGRGPGFKPERDEGEMISEKQYQYLTVTQIKDLIKKSLDEYKQALDEKKSTSQIRNRIKALNWAWDRKSNDLWEEVQKTFDQKRQILDEEQLRDYDWDAEEQEKQSKVRELAKLNYEARKDFYMNLFSDYEKKEYYFTQIEFEKRLVEEFMEFGQEICNNKEDDNENGEIDCEESQCGGKICGTKKVKIKIGSNETTDPNESSDPSETQEVVKDMYCIAKKCQLKEEIVEGKKAICGNHVCEEDETIASCAEDCSSCPIFPPVECGGIVLFSGKDENGCSLEPICIEENKTCETNEDCVQPLCAKAECVENVCQTTELEECRAADCVDGEKQITNCANGEKLVTGICSEGIWVALHVWCEQEEAEPVCGNNKCEKQEDAINCPQDCKEKPDEELDCVKCGNSCVTREKSMAMMCEQPTEDFVCIEDDGECKASYPEHFEEEEGEVEEEEILGNECVVKGDCGNEKDVCSNGRCITLPDVVEEEEEVEEEEIEEYIEEIEQEIQEKEQEEEEEEKEFEEEQKQENEDADITGQIISAFKKITGSFISITGYATENQDDTNDEPQEPAQETPQDEPTQEPAQETPKDEPDYEIDCIKCGDSCMNREHVGDKECEPPTKDFDCYPKEGSCVMSERGEDRDNYDEERDDEKWEDDKEWEEEWKEEEIHEIEKGVFTVRGTCRKIENKKEGFIYFGGWGDPFEEIHMLKNKYYQHEGDWCKYELENLIKQRKEFEKGFNQEYVEWFFEKYLTSSAEDWEKHISGIFELYWRSVENSERTVRMMECLDTKKLPDYNLIKFNYSAEYGSVEYWEEIKTTRLPGPEGNKETKILSPYMKIWIFPTKEFIIMEMKKAMQEHEFPGPPEEKMEREKEEGPTAEERELIKQDEKFMKKLKKITDKYGGDIDAAVQLKDYETGEIVFNLYVQINEEDIMKMKPMLPEEVPEKDVTITIDFEKVYELIEIGEKEMREAETEVPYWEHEKKERKPEEKIKDVKDGIKMALKIRGIINSAEYSPESAKDDAKSLARTFFFMMGKMDGRERERGEREEQREDKLNQDFNEQALEELFEREGGTEGGGEGIGDGKDLKYSGEFEDSFEQKEYITGEAIRK